MYVSYYVSEIGIAHVYLAGRWQTLDIHWLVCSESELFVGTLEELLG